MASKLIKYTWIRGSEDEEDENEGLEGSHGGHLLKDEIWDLNFEVLSG